VSDGAISAHETGPVHTPDKLTTAADCVRAAIAEFHAVQHRLAHYGAADTEPDWVSQHAVAVHLGLREGRHRLPTTPDQWELYTASMDCSAAASELTLALRKLIDALGPLYLASNSAKDAVRSQLWRLDLL